jgi:hypothetical protein
LISTISKKQRIFGGCSFANNIFGGFLQQTGVFVVMCAAAGAKAFFYKTVLLLERDYNPHIKERGIRAAKGADGSVFDVHSFLLR